MEQRRMPTNRDYWPAILGLANDQGKIQSPNRKSLDEYLAKELSLSRPTIRSLLSIWEEEGKIRLEKEGFSKKLFGLQILSPKEEVAPPGVEISQKVSKALGRAVILIDVENLQTNMEMPPPERFSMTAGFDRIIRQIAREVGEIVNVLVFVPPHLASSWGETFHKQGFFIIYCPKIRDKEGEEQDTVDSILTEFGKKMIAQNPDLTHLCIGSGDKDFASSDEKNFSPLVREAIRRGLKIIVVAGNLRSLSTELIKLADINPLTGQKMVYLFSPTEE